MFQKLKKTLSPYAVVLVGLTALVLITILGGLIQYSQELSKQSLQPAAKAVVNREISSPSNLTASNNPNDSLPSDVAPTNKNNPKTTAQAKQTPTSSNTFSQAGAVANQTTTISVVLSINGVMKGTVNISSPSNQCDVLAQALTKGLLSNLDMRYSAQYKTQAVYVIDGIGDPGSVWWTYKVNGSTPPYGCGAMPAHNGDSVNWQYVKT